jgi:hypothetical protein
MPVELREVASPEVLLFSAARGRTTSSVYGSARRPEASRSVAEQPAGRGRVCSPSAVRDSACRRASSRPSTLALPRVAQGRVNGSRKRRPFQCSLVVRSAVPPVCDFPRIRARGQSCMTAVEQRAGTAIRPSRADVPGEALAELRRRLAATRWPSRELVDDRSQVVQLATMQALARCWATEYDLGRVEARLNALPQDWENGRAQAQAAAAGQAAPEVSIPVGFTTFPARYSGPRAAGSKRPTPPSATSTRPTGAATSPHGRSPNCSPPNSGPRSVPCATHGPLSPVAEERISIPTGVRRPPRGAKQKGRNQT